MEIIRYMKEDGSVPLTEWLSTLRDLQAKIVILRRIDRYGAGNPGHTRYLRDGVSELKIDLGPGYRVFFALDGQAIVLLLCGGDKKTQDADIVKAIGYLEDWKKRNRSTT